MGFSPLSFRDDMVAEGQEPTTAWRGQIQTLEALSFGQRGRVVDIRLLRQFHRRSRGFVKGAKVTTAFWP